MLAIGCEIETLSRKAREKGLLLAEMSGGCFTVSYERCRCRSVLEIAGERTLAARRARRPYVKKYR